jgi:hypothetical protein
MMGRALGPWDPSLTTLRMSRRRLPIRFLLTGIHRANTEEGIQDMSIIIHTGSTRLISGPTSRRDTSTTQDIRPLPRDRHQCIRHHLRRTHRFLVDRCLLVATSFHHRDITPISTLWNITD